MARETADDTDGESTSDSRFRRASQMAASEVRKMGNATRDVPDPQPSGDSSSASAPSVPSDFNRGRRTTGSDDDDTDDDTGDSDAPSPPDDINRGRRGTDGTTSGTTNPPSGIPGDVNTGRRSGTPTSGGDSDTSTPSAPSDVSSPPDDLNRGRRGTDGTSSPDTTPSVDQPSQLNAGRRAGVTDSTDDTPSVTDTPTVDRPDDINTTRRTRPTTTDTPTGDLTPAIDRPDRGDTDDPTTGEIQAVYTNEQGLEENEFEYLGPTETTREAREIEQQVIQNTPYIDDESEVRVTRDGVELTAAGRQAQLEYARSQAETELASRIPGVDASGVTVSGMPGEFDVDLTDDARQAAAGLAPTSPQGGRRQIQETSLEQRRAAATGDAITPEDVDATVTDEGVEFDVQTAFGVESIAQRGGGRRQLQRQQIRERAAAASDDVDANDLTVSLRGGDVSVRLNDAARAERAREAVASENENIDPSDVTIDFDDDGTLSVGLTDDARIERARQQVLANNPELDEDDVTFSIETREAGDIIAVEGGDPVREGTEEYVDVDLTQSGERTLIQQQVAEDRANVDAEDVVVSFGDDGDPNVELAENFDDEGRFWLVPGGEEFVQDISDTVDDALTFTGEAVGTVYGAPSQFTAKVTGLSEPGETEVLDANKAFFTGGARVLNPFAAALALDEAGEVGGVGLRSAVSGRGGEFGRDLGQSTGRVVTGLQRQATQNPVEFTGMLAGSLFASSGAVRLASSSSSTAGRATAFAIQPGEELASVALTRGLRTTARGSRFTDSLPGGRVGFEELGIAGTRRAARGIRSRLPSDINTPGASRIRGTTSAARDALNRGVRVDVVQSGSGRLEISDNFGRSLERPDTGSIFSRVPSRPTAGDVRGRISQRVGEIDARQRITNIRDAFAERQAFRQDVADRVSTMRPPREIVGDARARLSDAANRPSELQQQITDTLFRARERTAFRIQDARTSLGFARRELPARARDSLTGITQRPGDFRQRLSDSAFRARERTAFSIQDARTSLGFARRELPARARDSLTGITQRPGNIRQQFLDRISRSASRARFGLRRTRRNLEFARSESFAIGRDGLSELRDTPTELRQNLSDRFFRGRERARFTIGDLETDLSFTLREGTARSRERLSDATELLRAEGDRTLRISPGRPPRRTTPELDLDDADVDAIFIDARADLESELNTDFDTTDAGQSATDDLDVESGTPGSDVTGTSQTAVTRTRIDTSRTGTGTDSTLRISELDTGPDEPIDIGASDLGPFATSDPIESAPSSALEPLDTSESTFEQSLAGESAVESDLGDALDLAPQLEPGFASDTETSIRSRADSRIAFENAFETDTRLDSRTDLTTDLAFDSGFETDLTTDFTFRTKTPPPRPRIKTRQPFDRDDDQPFGLLDSSEELFSTGFRDIDVNGL